MLKVLIVDDEALAAERLARLCAQLEDVAVAGIATDGESALHQLEAVRPDLVLLDISMPGLDGMALARILAHREHRPAIVFVTAHDDFAVAAFELGATDYLLKPVSLARLRLAAVRAAAAARPPQAAHLTELWAPRRGEMVRLGVETLDLLEAERDYVRLHSRGLTYLLRTTLQELERRLDPAHFVRVHRSVIVPLDRIRALRTEANGALTLQLLTGRSVRVGRSFRMLARSIASGSS